MLDIKCDACGAPITGARWFTSFSRERTFSACLIGPLANYDATGKPNERTKDVCCKGCLRYFFERWLEQADLEPGKPKQEQKPRTNTQPHYCQCETKPFGQYACLKCGGFGR